MSDQTPPESVQGVQNTAPSAAPGPAPAPMASALPPANPAPANPAPANPTPANPTPANPTPANPTPANPTPANPTPANPGPINPALANSANPAPVNPAQNHLQAFAARLYAEIISFAMIRNRPRILVVGRNVTAILQSLRGMNVPSVESLPSDQPPAQLQKEEAYDLIILTASTPLDFGTFATELQQWVPMLATGGELVTRLRHRHDATHGPWNVNANRYGRAAKTVGMELRYINGLPMFLGSEEAGDRLGLPTSSVDAYAAKKYVEAVVSSYSVIVNRDDTLHAALLNIVARLDQLARTLHEPLMPHLLDVDRYRLHALSHYFNQATGLWASFHKETPRSVRR
ncbi:hypothetical protein KC349_g8695 [Hortaea werneckii]|nr:hypothetical protein KC349_g8695 [Hortaea werneckii]